MKIWDNNFARDATPEEEEKILADQENDHLAAYKNSSYNDFVVAEIRKRYTLDQELAIKRQEHTKPDEYKAYFDYCEECKTFVKMKMKEVGR